MGGLLHWVQRGGDWAGTQSTASVPITVLLYDPLLYDCNVPIKGLNEHRVRVADSCDLRESFAVYNPFSCSLVARWLVPIIYECRPLMLATLRVTKKITLAKR